MHFTYYQDQYCYYFRKPAGIPSSFGKEFSFLDLLVQEQRNPQIQEIFLSLSSFFSPAEEYGLLNRLDNDTSGLLYFAKNPQVKKQFKELQGNLFVHKYYLAEVYGDVTPLMKGGAEGGGFDTAENPPSSPFPQFGWGAVQKGVYDISYPIMHHKFTPDRMVVIRTDSDRKKAKGREHQLTTKLLEYDYNTSKRTSIVLVEIQKGIRHQIRAHLAAIGHPICGDTLYSKSDHKEYPMLQLYSVGLETS